METEDREEGSSSSALLPFSFASEPMLVGEDGVGTLFLLSTLSGDADAIDNHRAESSRSFWYLPSVDFIVLFIVVFGLLPLMLVLVVYRIVLLVLDVVRFR